uniref:Uncharacterized protein n=1 Tax=Knipowitschia caucasica TaxID=637954 RepID=A0AAV2LKE7_KNICA
MSAMSCHIMKSDRQSMAIAQNRGISRWHIVVNKNLLRGISREMMENQVSMQRRLLRNPPGDKGLIKTSTYIVPCFLFVELVIMAGTVLLAYYFEYTDTFPVHVQGFFCFDKSYSKPYPGPEDNSKAPPVLVYSLVTAIPTVTVYILVVLLFVWMWRNHGDGHYICPRLEQPSQIAR